MTLLRRNPRRDANEPEIVDGLEQCGWIVIRFSVKHWPDLFLAKPHRNIWVEVKMPGEKPTKDQLEQHERMRSWGMTVLVAYDLTELLQQLGETA